MHEDNAKNLQALALKKHTSSSCKALISVCTSGKAPSILKAIYRALMLYHTHARVIIRHMCEYLDLFHSRSLEAEIEAVVGQRSNLLVVPIVAHADDGDL